MKDVSDLIPKHKHDTSTIKQLMGLTEKEIQPILPALLEWMADMNWPVAPHIVKVLAQFPNGITPLIKQALSPEADDNILKYWIISELLPQLPYENQYQLWHDFGRIADSPTDKEKMEEVDSLARKFEHRFCINNGLGLEQ